MVFNKRTYEVSKKQERKNTLPRNKKLTEPEWDVTGKLDLPHRGLKVTMISMQKTLKEKVENMQYQMNNFSRNIKTIKYNQMLGIKSTMKKAFETLASKFKYIYE